MEVEAEALSTIRQRSQKYAFQWRSTLAEGRARRECMDVELQEFKKCTKKNRDKENTIHLMHSFQSILYHADYSESYQDADDGKFKVKLSSNFNNSEIITIFLI